MRLKLGTQENGPVGENFANQRRVLIVDDNTNLARLFEYLLCSWGHTVKVVNDSTEAVREFSDFKPDIAMLDIGLPGLDGYAIAAELRYRSQTLTIIGVSSYKNHISAERLQEIGFNHYLTKPFDVKTLKEIVEIKV